MPKSESKKQNTLTYEALGQRMLHLNQEYGNMSVDAVFGAWQNAGGYNYMLGWPQIQNQRVKAINTLPAGYDKDKIAEFVDNPDSSEQELRAVSTALTFSAKTYDLILQTYQDLLTYDWYVYPSYTPNDINIETQKRDMMLAEKVARAMNISAKAHEIVGLCAQYGKVFYTPRISIDKSHNKVNYAFLQQLPTDYCKITGYNNGPGKYTVAFDLMYFMQPGMTPDQFGDLFWPYVDVFSQVIDTPRETDKYVYTSEKTPRIDIQKFNALGAGDTYGNPQWAQIGKRWAYWVTLPAEKVITFEFNDRTANVVPNTTGLFVSMVNIPNYEAAQMQIVLNPLTSIMTGELETYDVKSTPNADPIAVSPTVRKVFEKFWYDMLAQNNTSGIGLFMAPAKNLRLQTVSDTVSNTNIATTAVADQIQKAGLSSLIPTTNDPKVGVAEISAKINSQLPKIVYRSIERVMNWIFDSIGIKTPVRFRMFGDIFSHDKEVEQARKGMESGLLIETLKYDAMCGHTLMDDIAISEFVHKSGVLDNRIPLVTSYSAKQANSGLPPQPTNETITQDLNPGGRPQEDGSENSQKTEGSLFD